MKPNRPDLTHIERVQLGSNRAARRTGELFYCTKCKMAKPKEEMRHVHGIPISPCKQCDRLGTRTNRERPEKRLADAQYALRYRREHPDRIRQYNRHRTVIQFRAHLAVQRALQKGTLMKPSICEDCKETVQSLHGHHEDYTQQLNVVWLCNRCHRKRHRKD
jgi:hypothetical protein